MHPEDIKAEVRKRGETLTSLAKKHGLEKSACRDALRTRRARADIVIAEFLGLPLKVLWPTRYPSNGKNAESTNVEIRTTGKRRAQRLKRGAR